VSRDVAKLILSIPLNLLPAAVRTHFNGGRSLYYLVEGREVGMVKCLRNYLRFFYNLLLVR